MDYIRQAISFLAEYNCMLVHSRFLLEWNICQPKHHSSVLQQSESNTKLDGSACVCGGGGGGEGG